MADVNIRHSYHGKMKKIVDIANNIQERPLTLLEIDHLIERADAIMKNIEEVHNKIVTTCQTEEDLKIQDDAYEPMEETYRQARVKLLEIQLSLQQANPGQQTGGNQHQSASAKVKLPRIQLPTFTGKYDEWTSFRDLFFATIHNDIELSGAQKLQYLKSFLDDEPATLIRALTISNENYNEAWELLNDRYDNKREILNSVLNRLFGQKQLSNENAIDLQKLVDNAKECVRTLKVLKRPVEHWDDVLVHFYLKKLDQNTRRDWAIRLDGSKIPTFKEFTDFMDNHIRGLLASGSVSQKSAPQHKEKRQHIASHHVTTEARCSNCKGSHAIHKCQDFLGKSAAERSNIAKTKQLCFNCLKPDHRIMDCKSQYKCRKCSKKHNSLLHVDRQGQEASKDNSTPFTSGSASAVPDQVLSHHAMHHNSEVLLPTAIVLVPDSTGREQQCRILLDTGSQGTFISEQCVQRLGLKREQCNATVTGVSSASSVTTRGQVQVTLKSQYNDISIKVNAMILSKVTSLLPKYQCQFVNWKHISDLQLADPTFYKPGDIDLLVGADYAAGMFNQGQRSGGPNTPTAQETIFGWILMGRITHDVQMTVQSNHSLLHIEEILQRFWEVEEPPKTKALSIEERKCEEHFRSTYKRSDDGRFILQLPFNEKRSQLGESMNIAVKRLHQVERRLSTHPEWREEYNKFMAEYESLGHMELITQPALNPNQVNYLPHHFVVNSSSTTTKFRVVFDGSAKTTTGVSLNNALLVGPTVQDELFAILLRFRIHQVVIKADIAKMYRQFYIDNDDCDMQRILWRAKPTDPIKEYRLLTCTYGTSCAPYIATRCLQQLGMDITDQYPGASGAFLNDTYVDDVMSGTETSSTAIQLYHELTTAASTAGLELRKWCSNDSTVLNVIPADKRETEVNLGIDKTCEVKALGIKWNPAADTFVYSVSKMTFDDQLPTKRVLLSKIAQVFDPLGFLSAITIRAKMILQDLWKLSLDWDDLLPKSMQDEWIEFCADLKTITEVSIQRCITIPNPVMYELHGFSDASEKAYGAIIYLKAIDSEGHVSIKLVTSKAKVSPIKQITLPRLELCGAVVLAKLMKYVSNALKLQAKQYCWTDSTIVLRWISALPRKWKTYIANRVGTIQENTDIESWRHVPGTENPADILSRGSSATQLLNSKMWWYGPTWLEDKKVPVFLPAEQQENIDAEERKVNLIVYHMNIEEMSKVSSLTKLKRIMAYCLRFLHNVKHRDQTKTGALTPSELKSSFYVLIREVQKSSFSSDLQAIKSKSVVGSNSKLKTLNPFIDHDGLLRVGGRLQKANISERKKHPIILPYKSHLVDLIISYFHLSLLHGGFQVTWTALQQEFWILRGRDMVRHFIRRCVICRRYRAQHAIQLMGNLPSPRVTPTRPFLNVGVDYAGPFMLRNMVGRSSKVFKGYLSVFVCMSTKAVHLEAVSDLTTEAFIATLRRFTSRRGLCLNIYSDQGTNFIGADAEIQRLIRSAEHNEKIATNIATQNISWHFNVPSAPHHGGLWEAAVKSAKFHLKRVLGNSLCTFEKFQTILCQVEAVMNSRPLCPLSTDPADLNALTPGHFIIGEPLTSLPDNDLSNTNQNRLSMWQQLQQRVQHFWLRWRQEYLSSLQQRQKWLRPKEDIRIGDLVIIKDDNNPPGKWKLGRILQVHAGDDGRIRTATIKTATGVMQRPIVKLVPLLSE